VAARNFTPQEALDSGVVQEINRRLLHMRGLALGVNPHTGHMTITFDDDPEGWFFNEKSNWSREKAEAFDGLIVSDRWDNLGYEVQPLPDA
jgi:hypothetical protein